jgi:hypothetical protein
LYQNDQAPFITAPDGAVDGVVVIIIEIVQDDKITFLFIIHRLEERNQAF